MIDLSWDVILEGLRAGILTEFTVRHQSNLAAHLGMNIP